MRSHIETVFLHDFILNVINLRQRHFVYLSALTANKMVVLDIVHCLLVSIALVELMLHEKSSIY